MNKPLLTILNNLLTTREPPISARSLGRTIVNIEIKANEHLKNNRGSRNTFSLPDQKLPSIYRNLKIGINQVSRTPVRNDGRSPASTQAL
ncbi:hypothetical protein [Burkholderia stagnalis]|uniref:hypothetical protein n=1 Tax=Burkholderia stagnalis TaxID=1503054 RepID=UPI0012D8D9AB|nr:hypothetical protein [Burkholderia stagnalis]